MDKFATFEELSSLYLKGVVKDNQQVSILNENNGFELVEERINIGDAINIFYNYEQTQ